MKKSTKLQEVLNEYKKNVARFKEETFLLDIELNTVCAKKEEILKTEEKLGCSLPQELKDYYLNDANGTVEDMNSYGDYGLLTVTTGNSFDVFSHQRIFGIVDFSAKYWVEENPFDYDTSRLTELYEEEKERLKFYNKEFFVCAVHWKQNFLETFLFDKEHNFYNFCFDQDVTIGDYIDAILNDKIAKHRSLSPLIEKYLQEQITEIEESLD